MRAIWITKAGGPEVLEVRETPDPVPKPGEVRIRTGACGLNFAELMARTDPVTMRNSITPTLALANDQLRAAEALSPPDQMSAAQSNILDALTDRRDGIQTIATNIEAARNSSNTRDAIAAITSSMVLGLVLLIAGIGLLRVKPWARQLSIIWAVVRIVFVAATAICK